MTTLVINDLMESKELDSKAMAGVFGGEGLSSLFNLSNNVADFDFAQAFQVNTTAANLSSINAAQGNVNLNGTQQANQDIYVDQDAYAETYDIGNLDVHVG